VSFFREITVSATPLWVFDLLRAIDARDSARFATFLSPECVFRFGSAPLVTGRSAVESVVAGFFELIRGCQHELLRTWEEGEWLTLQGEVTYTRLDSSTVRVPFVNVFRMRTALIAEYLIYIDNTPLFVPTPQGFQVARTP
jgi:hypothetical protein